jgi:hypothetical protein
MNSILLTHRVAYEIRKRLVVFGGRGRDGDEEDEDEEGGDGAAARRKKGPAPPSQQKAGAMAGATGGAATGVEGHYGPIGAVAWR